MMNGSGPYGWGAAYMGGWFFMFLFWVLVIVGIVLLLRWLAASATAGRKSTSAQNTALQALEERYARGELSREEFLEKKRDLGA